ncbi:IS3 family transposase [Amycolatopsis panacis]|uniref:IS3 family transposase n=1 Tax=Amycolatopsis panacis TaxID=2340917 RepID=UPI0038993594
MAVAEYVDWYNHRRIHRELGHLTPAQTEADQRESRYDQPREPARARCQTTRPAPNPGRIKTSAAVSL